MVDIANLGLHIAVPLRRLRRGNSSSTDRKEYIKIPALRSSLSLIY